MSAVCYVHWQRDGVWLGYLEEIPDYITQGHTLAELQENLRDLYRDLTSGGGNTPGPPLRETMNP